MSRPGRRPPPARAPGAARDLGPLAVAPPAAPVGTGAGAGPAGAEPGDAPGEGGGPLRLRLADDGRIPNHPRLPLLLWRRVAPLDPRDPAATLEALLAGSGWIPSWRDGIWPFPHDHSSAHEALGIARGRARVRFGGEAGPIPLVEPGDLVLVPAGVGHQRIGPAPDLLVVGAYPPGQSPDLCRGLPGERAAALARIAALPDPPDPVRGGPLALAGTAGARPGAR